jgi:hypothetical protein
VTVGATTRPPNRCRSRSNRRRQRVSIGTLSRSSPPLRSNSARFRSSAELVTGPARTPTIRFLTRRNEQPPLRRSPTTAGRLQRRELVRRLSPTGARRMELFLAVFHSSFRRSWGVYGDPSNLSADNYGFLDQRLALEWVRAHIASFGGDPNRITIAGQSAGGLSVSLHLVSPRSHWLFDRAIMQGGFASYRWRTREDGEAQGDEFATALGCDEHFE